MPREGRRQLEQAIGRLLDKKADKPRLVPALLGAYFNGQKTLRVAARADFVWARIRGSTSEVIQAFNETVSLHWDLPVLVYRDPAQPDIWKVYGRDVRAYEDWGGVSYLPPHADAHTFGGGKTGSDVVWVQKRQYMPLMPHPNPTGTLSIFIEPDFYFFGGEVRWWPGSGTASLAAYKPTGSFTGRFVTIYLNEAGNPDFLQGPEFSALDVPTDPAVFITVPTPAQGVPVAAVLLLSGTQNIGWGEVYDLRNPNQPLARVADVSGTMVFYDEGALAGVAGRLNVAGERATVRVSGTYATLTISPDPLEQIGIDNMVYGFPLGTGTRVDWGNNLAVTISGTVIRVDAMAGGQGGGIFPGGVLAVADTFPLLYTFTGSANDQHVNNAVWEDIADLSGSFLLNNRSDVLVEMMVTISNITTAWENSQLRAKIDGEPIGPSFMRQQDSAAVATLEWYLAYHGVKAALASGVHTIEGQWLTSSDLNVNLQNRRLTILAATGGMLMRSGTAAIGILDDGIYLGVANVFDFGNNLDLSLSGSSLRVDAQAGGVGGGAGVMVWDEGVPLGTGTVLNFVGPNVDASISGSVVRVFVSGTGAGGGHQTGTVVIYDEGTFLGVFDEMRFIGAGVDALNSGSYAAISIPGGGVTPPFAGVDQIGVYGLDNGAPVGTGTWLDFGDNLEATLSGTVLQINVRGGAGIQDYFFYQTGSDVGGYRKMLPSPSPGIEQSVSATITTATGTVATFLTDATYPGVDFIPDGIWHVHIHADRTAGTRPASILGEVFKRTYPGGVETILLETEAHTLPLLGGVVQHDLERAASEFEIAPTDRIGARILVASAGGGSDPTIAIYYEGGTSSRLEIPSNAGNVIALTAHQEQGVPLGSARVFDWGNNLDASISGATVRIDAIIPPEPQEQIGVMGWAEGAPIGTGTIINFVGAGVIASRSGTVIDVNVAGGGGPGGGQIGLMGWDSGVPVGTGAILDARTGLSLSLSGTVLTLDVELPLTGTVVVRDEAGVLGSAAVMDFVGPGVSAAISGSYARISIPGPGVDQIGIMGWDDGVPLGTGTVIDATSGLRLTLSGTVLDLTVEPPVTGSIVVRDEAGVLGSAVTLDFVGPGVSAAISGSYARVSIPGPGVDQIGVLGLDDGIPIGTGTSLDAGNFLSLSLSGTRLRLDAVLPPEPAEQIGIWGLDDGVPQGTGTSLDAGDYLRLTISGTRLRADVLLPPEPAEQIGVMGWDEGVPFGTGTILNFVGAGVVGSLSGTVIEVNIAGAAVSLPITGTVVVRDEGGVLGSAAVIDFQGAGVTATISGTYAQITVAGAGAGGGGEIGIYGLDDGVPVGTGSWLEAGSSISASRSGTVIRLDVPTPVTGTLSISYQGSSAAEKRWLGIIGNVFADLDAGLSLILNIPYSTGSVIVHDEGRSLGSVFRMNFRGDGVTVNRSGTYADIFIPGAPPPQIGIFGLDDGIPQGTGTSLDAGYGLRLTLSGTLLDLRVEPPISGSFVLRDEAGVLGSVTVLDFQGAGVTASLSGTYGQVTIPGGGATPTPVTGTVVVRDEAGVLGSASILDFQGAGVTAVLSGSYAQITIPGGGTGPAGGGPQQTVFAERLVESGVLASETGSMVFVFPPTGTVDIHIRVNTRLVSGSTENALLAYFDGQTTGSAYEGAFEEYGDAGPNEGHRVVHFGTSLVGLIIGTGTAYRGFSHLDILIPHHRETGSFPVLIWESHTAAAASLVTGTQAMGQIHQMAYKGVSDLRLSSSNIFAVNSFWEMYAVGPVTVGQGATGPEGPVGPAQFGVMGWDEGVPIGTGSILNFLGAGVTASRSGTVIEVNVPGGGVGGGGQIGLMGWDNGVPVGTGAILDARTGLSLSRSGTVLTLDVELPLTGTVVVRDEAGVLGSAAVLDFVGPGVSTSISGSYARVSVPGPGVDQIGVFGLDDGIPVGTGTSLDAGNFLSLSLSGTRLRLDAILPPEPAEQIGAMAWDEGVPIGTGTIFNFLGAGVIASRSGTVIEVNVAGGGGSPPITGSVVVRDEAGVLGSATTLDFQGAGVTATISGAYAQITVVAGSSGPPGPFGVGISNEGLFAGTGTVLDLNYGIIGSLSGSNVDVRIGGSPSGTIGAFQSAALQYPAQWFAGQGVGFRQFTGSSNRLGSFAVELLATGSFTNVAGTAEAPFEHYTWTYANPQQDGYFISAAQTAMSNSMTSGTVPHSAMRAFPFVPRVTCRLAGVAIRTCDAAASSRVRVAIQRDAGMTIGGSLIAEFEFNTSTGAGGVHYCSTSGASAPLMAGQLYWSLFETGPSGTASSILALFSQGTLAPIGWDNTLITAGINRVFNNRPQIGQLWPRSYNTMSGVLSYSPVALIDVPLPAMALKIDGWPTGGNYI